MSKQKKNAKISSEKEQSQIQSMQDVSMESMVSKTGFKEKEMVPSRKNMQR